MENNLVIVLINHFIIHVSGAYIMFTKVYIGRLEMQYCRFPDILKVAKLILTLVQ